MGLNPAGITKQEQSAYQLRGFGLFFFYRTTGLSLTTQKEFYYLKRIHMLIDERNERKQRVLEAARMMATAARTAPKAKGIDIIEIVIATDEHIQQIAQQLHVLHEESGMKFLLRDAENIQQGDALLLIGTRSQPQGLNCGYCGFPACESRTAGAPCAINSTDLGIAIGSACSTAMDLRIDTRVMFSAGWAAQRLNIPADCTQVYAIALSCSSKNPFFDRKPKENPTESK